MRSSRREFVAGASLAVSGAWMFRSDAQSKPQGARLTVLVDERIADSRAFALRARIAGARVMPLRHEIGGLWFDRLLPLTASQGSVIAGLTTHADAFLLARFALASGLTVTGALVAWRIERSS
jgi:hypothetical protein